MILLVGLVGGLAGTRWLRARGLSRVRAGWSRPLGGPRLWAVLAAVTLLASAPLFTAVWTFVASGAHLPGDAASHAQIAREVAERGLPHGWVESYSGGFPFGPHYQSGAILLTAALVKLRMTAVSATHLVGLVSILLAPLLFLFAARAAGAAPAGALAGALILSWIVPVHVYMGGPWVMLAQGLVSQAFSVPWLLLLAMIVLGRRGAGAAPVLAAFAMASHAQITLCVFGAAAPAILIYGAPRARRRFLVASVGAAAVALALYGPGARSFSVPFSWPNVPLFRIIGFELDRLGRWWFEGELLDVGRFPALTILLWLALLVLFFTAQSRAARGALLFFATTLVFSFSGPILAEMGTIGPRIIEVFSPVRMLCVLPFAVAVVVCVGWTELSARLRRALEPTGAWWLVRSRLFEILLTAYLCAGAGVHALSLMRARVAFEDTYRAQGCEPQGFGGYRSAAIVDRLRAPGRGRFVVDQETSHTPCPVLHGIELESAVPLGSGSAGPGSQVGVLVAAFDALRVDQDGGASRAEALGVRTILHSIARPPAPPGAWRQIAAGGHTALSERISGTDRVGVGCVTEVWRGADRALRDALFVDLSNRTGRPPSALALNPSALIHLEATQGPVQREPVSRGACDSTKATIEEFPRGPGVHEAVVRTRAEVDVVVRSTYFKTWTVRVDGVLTPARLVAPGFMAVRVPPGEHRILAVVSLLPWYIEGLLAAAASLGLLVWVDRRGSTAGGRRPSPSR